MPFTQTQPCRRGAMRRTVVWLILLRLILAIPTAQAQTESPGTETGNRPVLFLGNDSLPPMCFLQDDRPAGIVVDLARAIAARMPSRVDVRLMSWAAAQQLVLQERADALLQINSSPDRLRLYDFSDPLLTSEFTIFIRAGRMGIAGKDDLRGLRVGVEEKGLPVLLLREYPEVSVQTVSDIAQAFRMLVTGAVDAVVADRWVGEYALAENRIDGVRATTVPIERSYSAIAVKKGNTNLLRQVNAVLADLRSDGTYDRILQSWQSAEVVFKTREQLRRQAWLTVVMAGALVAALASVAALAWEVRRRRRAEGAMWESRALMQAVMDRLPDAVFLKDAQSRIIVANPATLKVIGKSLDEVIGKNDCEHYADPEVGRAIMANDRRVMASGATEVVEEVGLASDGYRTYLSTKVPWRDAEGRVVGLLGIARDITEHKKAEDALRESEAKYRNLFENMTEEVHFWQLVRDGQGRIKTWRLVDANPPTLKTWGRTSVEEIRGRTTDEIFGPGATEHYLPVVQKIMAEGVPHSFEDYFPHLDKYFRFTSVPLGEYFITTGADITAIKKTEEAVRASEGRLVAVLESMPDAFVSFDANLCYTYVNGNAERLQGASREDLLGKDVRAVYPDPESYKTISQYERALRERTSLTFVSHHAGFNRWVEVRAFATPDGVSVFYKDVSEKIRADEALRESEARFRLALRNAPVSVAAQDRDLRFVWAYNQRSARRDEIIGHTDHDLFTPEEAEQFVAIKRRVLDEGIEYREQRWLERPTGRLFLDICWEPIRDATGRVVGVASATVDHTPIKLAEEALKAALQEREVLLKEVHHRVKNNMQVLASLVSLQADGVVDPATRDVLNDFRDQVRTMALVHENLYQSASLANIDFADYAARLTASLARSHRRENVDIRLTLDVEPLTLPIESAVPCGLILNELVTNAYKHAFRGRGSGEIVISLHADPAGRVRLGVCDNGVGLPADTDWRQSPSLGLRLVQMLARQLRGNVECRKPEAGGTGFMVEFGGKLQSSATVY